MNEKIINRVFVTGVAILFALVFVQLSVTGYPFAGICCLASAIAVVIVAKAEEERVK